MRGVRTYLRAQGLNRGAAAGVAGFAVMALAGRINLVLFLEVQSLIDAAFSLTAPTVVGVAGLTALTFGLGPRHLPSLAAAQTRPTWQTYLPLTAVQIVVVGCAAAAVGAIPQGGLQYGESTGPGHVLALAALVAGIIMTLRCLVDSMAAQLVVVVVVLVLSMPSVLPFEVNPLFNTEWAPTNALVGTALMVVAIGVRVSTRPTFSVVHVPRG